MIDNLNVNTSIFKKEKVKLQPKHTLPRALMIASVLLLTGCGNRNYYDYSTINNNSTSLNTTMENNSTIIDEFEDEISKNDAFDKTTNTAEIESLIIQNSEITKNYIESLNNITTNYTYSDLYQTNIYLNRYQNTKSFSNHHDDTLEEVTVSSLYNKVLENNKKYLKEIEEAKSFTFYKELTNSEVKEICQYIIETYNNYSKKDQANINEVKCILNNLKIFQNASASNAFVDNDYCMVVSPGMVDVLGIMNEGVDVYKDTIIHETVHLFQMSCPDRINETDKMIGISPKYEEGILNPLDFSWFYEASAEKCMTNQTGDAPLVYEYMINYLESLSMSTILNNEVEVNQTETLCFTKDLNTIFDMYGCKTEAEKIEIINMMYSVQIIEVEPDEFFNSLPNELTEDEKAALKKDLRSSFSTTQTKYFYKNLLQAITEKNVTLQDIFYLITLFEADLNSHIKYQKIENYPYYEEFLNNYQTIQNGFFEVVAASSGYNQEEILEKFNHYSVYKNVDGELEKNYTLNWLSNDKREYLEERSEQLKTYSTANIQFVIKQRNLDENMIK